IISALPPQPFIYKFYIIKEVVYNAFATPAGNIFINSGLFEAMDNEDELAGILGHEIAHVVCRHISQKIERSKKIGIGTLAGIAAGIFLGAGGAAAAASAVSIGSMAAGQSLSLAYSREDEMQADQLGLKYTTKAGYSTAGLLTMLNKIRSRQWFGSKQIPTYLTTHPAVEDRIIYISSWVENNPKKTSRTSIKASHDFEIAHTRIISIYGDKNRALRKFKTDVKNHPSNPMAHYGYGLILARTGNRKDAISHLKTALKKAAFDPNILKDLGRIYFLDGRYPEAYSTLNSADSLIPDDSETLFFLGRTQIGLGKPDEALLTLEKLISINPDYTQALYFLGETYGKQEKLDKAHYYLGMYYKNKKQYKNARFHLYRALKIIKDQDKRQKIEIMLKEISTGQSAKTAW
ncbi:MAG: M48 family metalloprotease, partial [Thermodesulfobacteriota bacterium]|nr:M48 family metalloprotease [Thermodesulfobacteriota bacterium]